MAGELGVERFRDVFEKLYETLKSVHENERKLTKKCRQLNDEIAVNVARVSAVLVLTQQEEMTNTEMRQVTASSSSTPVRCRRTRCHGNATKDRTFLSDFQFEAPCCRKSSNKLRVLS